MLWRIRKQRMPENAFQLYEAKRNCARIRVGKRNLRPTDLTRYVRNQAEMSVTPYHIVVHIIIITFTNSQNHTYFVPLAQLEHGKSLLSQFIGRRPGGDPMESSQFCRTSFPPISLTMLPLFSIGPWCVFYSHSRMAGRLLDALYCLFVKQLKRRLRSHQWYMYEVLFDIILLQYHLNS